MTTLIYLTGIFVFALVIYLTLELVPAAPTGRLAETLTPADGVVLSGWRKSLSPLDKQVLRWTPPGFLRKTSADLYWAHIAGSWNEWNEVQFTSLRVALAVAGFGLGMVSTAEPVFSLVGGLVGFQYPAMSMAGAARRVRRQFVTQLPEFVQLVSAQMSANVSMEEALRRTSRAQSLVGKWMRGVLQMAQGRELIEQMQREARESQLPELIGMAVQLEFIRRGTAQHELMGQLASSIAADYIGSAEQRAEKVGSELVIPMVIFYFLPFLLTILTVIGWPIVQNLGAQ
jgi:Flp pilus assembly protein TadB